MCYTWIYFLDVDMVSMINVKTITPFLQMIQNLSIYSNAEVEKTSKFLHRNANWESSLGFPWTVRNINPLTW